MPHCIAISIGIKEHGIFVVCTGKTLYSDGSYVLEFLLKLKDKQQIIPNNAEIQHVRSLPLKCNIDHTVFRINHFACMV